MVEMAFAVSHISDPLQDHLHPGFNCPTRNPRRSPHCSLLNWLLRNGTSLVVARELARHSDVKMTMGYTHIGLEDQAKGIQNLPTDPGWLSSLRPEEQKSQRISSSSQHICSKSGVSEGQSESPDGSECHSSGKNGVKASPCQMSPCGTHRQKKAPPVTGDALVEDRGFLVKNRNPMKYNTLRIDRFSNWT